MAKKKKKAIATKLITRTNQIKIFEAMIIFLIEYKIIEYS
jgi:hypothetical protein